MSTGAHRGHTTGPIRSAVLIARVQRERLDAQRLRIGLPALPPLEVRATGAAAAPTYTPLARRHLALILLAGVAAFVVSVLVGTAVANRAPGYARHLPPAGTVTQAP